MAVIFFVMGAETVLCQTLEAKMESENVDMMAFVQLGNFSDRGVIALLVRQTIHPGMADSSSSAKNDIPRDIVDLLSLRQDATSQESQSARWPFEFESLTQRDFEPKAIVNRFQQHGLIELFFCENTKLLDSPLTARKELMAQVTKITEKIAPTLAAPYSRTLTESELLIVAGLIRQLSIELDNEILKALSSAERARVSKLVSHVLPAAIADAKESSQRFAFGSAFMKAFAGSDKK